MKNIIRYLKDYIHLLESQLKYRDNAYMEYVNKKKYMILEEIKKLETK